MLLFRTSRYELHRLLSILRNELHRLGSSFEELLCGLSAANMPLNRACFMQIAAHMCESIPITCEAEPGGHWQTCS
eukprot:2681023-Amphidinium_carterae.1